MVLKYQEQDEAQRKEMRIIERCNKSQLINCGVPLPYLGASRLMVVPCPLSILNFFFLENPAYCGFKFPN